jgi:3-hydroxybutyryl-CoA dehydratase
MSGVQVDVTRHHVVLLGFDDLVVGDEWESARRTVTETDVTLFAGLTGDFNPLHVDHAWSKSDGPFGKPVAHGLLGLALAAGLASSAPRVDTMALLGVLEWKFLLPIAFGDTLRVISTVEAVDPQSRGRRATVTWRRRLLNQDDQLVQEGRTQTLVRARPKPDGSPPPQA